MIPHTQIAIQAKELGLTFRKRSNDRRTLKTMLLNLSQRKQYEQFWALSNFNATMKSGETWGIIGRNGSGKSTLLKLITGILKPDRGVLKVKGRVSALLELGAGFQPDLTGMENIYLNGSLLGLSKREIQKRIDDIVEFSGIASFINTPVKHYSSGMYMRLGFAIAVNVEPDILLIDEIFAVGDLPFQERCMDRISRFKAAGKTILLVSHDMSAIRAMCQKVIWLHQGEIKRSGDCEEVIDYYLNETSSEDTAVELSNFDGNAKRWGTGTVKITEVQITDAQWKEKNHFMSREQFGVIIKYFCKNQVVSPVFGIAIHRSDGVHVCGPNTQQNNFHVGNIKGHGEIRFSVPVLPLTGGTYLLSAVVYDTHAVVAYDHHDRMYPFSVRNKPGGETYGVLNLEGTWQRMV